MARPPPPRESRVYLKSAPPKDAKAFIAYLTAGDPASGATVPLVLALERGGADLIELGVPFSDPIADGPVIQRASERALESGNHSEAHSRDGA